eukprot:CAMPEP_0204567300 /NCGR_PEP_ID=MMETSP0661-20131031/36525_1 /ASSEMBLY_ACC=CAM_ASM_000606 /TAXON_ID=109239 /ORGANISM="Alexandrium margalefi, Strain AMGDE01CS-322" /LENGTH=179 /DNA_ID=CAMNT_0051575201 /DNA_START=15 /DNA_END=550 /DNA_ORIENTATION=+
MEILDGMDGVVLRARQKDACSKINDLKNTSMRPVATVPQAADEEIIFDLRGILDSPRASRGSGTICLISDDGGFIKTLRMAQDRGWRLVVVAQRESMLDRGDRGVEWDELMVDAASMPGAAAWRRARRLLFQPLLLEPLTGSRGCISKCGLTGVPGHAASHKAAGGFPLFHRLPRASLP